MKALIGLSGAFFSFSRLAPGPEVVVDSPPRGCVEECGREGIAEKGEVNTSFTFNTLINVLLTRRFFSLPPPLVLPWLHIG